MNQVPDVAADTPRRPVLTPDNSPDSKGGGNWLFVSECFDSLPLIPQSNHVNAELLSVVYGR